MKTTRLILALAAALSLGLAVFANVRTNHNAVTSTQSVITSDEVVTVSSGAQSAANGIKVTYGNSCPFAGQSAANGIKVTYGNSCPALPDNLLQTESKSPMATAVPLLDNRLKASRHNFNRCVILIATRRALAPGEFFYAWELEGAKPSVKLIVKMAQSLSFSRLEAEVRQAAGPTRSAAAKSSADRWQTPVPT